MFRTMTLAVFLTVPDAPPVPYLAPLQIELEALKTDILTGEPLRLTGIWTASSPIKVFPLRIEVWIDRGGGYTQWQEWVRGSPAITQEDVVTVGPGLRFATAHVVAAADGRSVGRRERAVLAFEDAGTFRIRLRYAFRDESVLSNVVTVTVTHPESTDRTLYTEHIRRRPQLVTENAADFAPVLANLFQEYPGSPYLARPFILTMARRVLHAMAAAPETYPLMGEVPELLNRLASQDLGGTPFDEDRLMLLAEKQEESGRRAEAFLTWTEILARYPRGVAAMKARRRLAVASPSPAS